MDYDSDKFNDIEFIRAFRLPKKLLISNSCRSHLTIAFIPLTLFRSIDRIILTDDTARREIVGESEIKTNSFHHQAVKAVAPGFVASAVADDGTVEAIEPAVKSDRFFLAVQWHPEYLVKTDAPAKKIFEAFVEAAKKELK